MGRELLRHSLEVTNRVRSSGTLTIPWFSLYS